MTAGRHIVHVAGWVVLVVLAFVTFNFVLPLPGVVSAIPFPDLPDIPAWAKWVWRAVVIGAIALAVVGELEKERSHERRGPEEEDES